MNPYNQGYTACFMGEERDNNPYTKYSNQYYLWDDGWMAKFME